MNRSVTAITLAVLATAGCSAAGNSGESEDTGSADISVLTLEVGSCLNDVDQPIAQEMTEIPSVPCSEPHQSEVYAEVVVDDASFPGVDAVAALASEACEAEFARFMGLPYDESTLSFHFYYPTQSSWAVGDRSVFCVVYDPAGDSEGTLANSQR
jgi:hypothetical protein